MPKLLLSASPEERLEQLRSLRPRERKLLLDYATSEVPIPPWPYGMPASAAPHVVLLGVSPGNGLSAADRGSGTEGRAGSRPTVGKADCGFDWRDPRRYWETSSDLCAFMVQRDAPKMAPRDALALAAHLNLGTGQNGTAGDAAIEKRILRWVSLLLHSKFPAELLICFGLWASFEKKNISNSGLQVVDLLSIGTNQTRRARLENTSSAYGKRVARMVNKWPC